MPSGRTTGRWHRGGKSRRDDGAAVMAGGPGVDLWCCTKHSKHQGQSEGKPNHSDACSAKNRPFFWDPKGGPLKKVTRFFSVIRRPITPLSRSDKKTVRHVFVGHL